MLCEVFRHCLASGEAGNSCDTVWCFHLPSSDIDTTILDFNFVIKSVVSHACSAISRLLLIVWIVSWNSTIFCVCDNALSVVKIDRPCIWGKRLLIIWSTHCCTCITTALVRSEDVEVILHWHLKVVSNFDSVVTNKSNTYQDIILFWYLQVSFPLWTWSILISAYRWYILARELTKSKYICQHRIVERRWDFGRTNNIGLWSRCHVHGQLGCCRSARRVVERMDQLSRHPIINKKP